MDEAAARQHRFADAEERVLPVLVPSIARVKDFVTGDAAPFTGDSTTAASSSSRP